MGYVYQHPQLVHSDYGLFSKIRQSLFHNRAVG